MIYLSPRQYYIDRYDLSTIKNCLMLVGVRNSMYKDKKLKRKYPTEKHKYEVDKVIRRQMFLTKTMEYQRKDVTIERWMSEDREIQKKYDSAVCPIIKCEHCGRRLEQLNKSFEGYHHLTDKVSFTLICNDCRNIKHVYEDGTVEIPEPDRCEKCRSIVKVERTFTDDISISKYKCSNCGHESRKEFNDKEFNRQFEEDKRKDKELLAKYRNEFCLSKEEGDMAVDVLEQVKFAQEVYEHEIEKYKDEQKERVFNVKKLTIQEVERFLTNKLSPEGFEKLNFGRVVLDKFVAVPFSIQDSNSNRRKEDSIADFLKLCKSELVYTNWRLIESDVMYRLGFISGTLKGYERQEDIERLFSHSASKKQKTFDPEKMTKYGYSNVVRLAKLCADFEGKEILRRKKLKAFSNGYYLESEDDNSFRCSICEQWTHGRDTWYDEHGMRCSICQYNISQGTIPAELCSKKDSWFSSANMRYQFGVLASTMKKLIRIGELRGIELKDREGNPYLTVFLKKDNKEFLAMHTEKEFSLPVTIKDEQGREIRL